MFEAPERQAEPRVARLAGRDVPYTLQRSVKRRRVVLTIDERGLVVHVPWSAPERAVNDALQHASQWALRKLDAWERQRPRVRQWRSGELVDFLGRQVRLQLSVRAGTSLAHLTEDGMLEVALPPPHTPERVRAAVVQWYRRRALAHFTARTEHYCTLVGAGTPRVLLSNARSRWGSCNAAGEVRLNWRLMQAASSVIDYVVAHEVAHLKYMSHGPRFWGTVARLYPEYESARVELNACAHHYMAL